MYSPEEDTPSSKKDHQKILEKIKRHALFLLARRDHSSLELKQKLLRKGYPAADIQTILSRLEESDYINPHRFAECYAHSRRNKGYGPRRIAMELQTKGIPEAVIAEQVKITDNAWFTEIRAVWRKQFKGLLPKDPQQRARQQRFLYNRGFSQEQIASIFKHAENLDEMTNLSDEYNE